MKKALVVGCGLSGATAARLLADKGYFVTIWERRNHIGGNMYDYYDEYGIPVHKYGPHTFHTNDEDVYRFICKYGEWEEYHLKCGAVIDGITTPTPFNFTTIDQFYGKEKAGQLKQALQKEYPSKTTVTVLEVLNSKNELVKEYGEFLFKKDYSLYTAKQWGLDPKEIDPSILKRVPLRLGYEEGYFDDKYQLMPKGLYVDFFKNLLNHPNIEVKLNINALEHLKIENNEIVIDGKETNDLIIYTGAIDELFNYRFGKLPYRSLTFEFKHSKATTIQKYAVEAHPAHPEVTRKVEFKQMYPTRTYQGSTWEEERSLEYRQDKHNEPYYPVLTKESLKIYKMYLNLTNQLKSLRLHGRLATFKYSNMDQIIKINLKALLPLDQN